jgi:hypothetical protein
MDIVKKFRLALELNDMTYLSFARKYGLSKQAISLAVQALKHGFTNYLTQTRPLEQMPWSIHCFYIDSDNIIMNWNICTLKSTKHETAI